MGKRLSAAAVEQYERDGYYFPVRVLSDEEARQQRERLERVERDLGGPLRGVYRIKPHLLFTWLAELVRHPGDPRRRRGRPRPGPAVLELVLLHEGGAEPRLRLLAPGRDVLGTERAGRRSPRGSPSRRARPRTGICGSCRAATGARARTSTRFTPDNLLSRGQEIAVEVDEREAVDMVLEPGEMSLHHVLMVHGSSANPSDDRRIGYAIRYIPTHVRQTRGPRDSATLVRGADTVGHFDLEPRPRGRPRPGDARPARAHQRSASADLVPGHGPNQLLNCYTWNPERRAPRLLRAAGRRPRPIRVRRVPPGRRGDPRSSSGKGIASRRTAR